MIRMTLRQIIEQSLQQAESNGAIASIGALPLFSVEAPKIEQKCDYASNIALLLAKQVGKSPRDLAEIIIKNIVDDHHVVESVNIAGPGFINFTVAKTEIQSLVTYILQKGESYGHTTRKTPRRVQIEFVSANPTGPLHLGHARGAFMGDAVARLFAASGCEVTREFYVNDTGKQIKTLGRTIYARYEELFGKKVELAADAYPGSYIIDIAKTLQQQDGEKWLDKDESEWLPVCIDIGIRENLKDIRNTLESAGIKFDVWSHESTLHNEGKIDQLIEEYGSRGMLYEAAVAQGTEDKIRREDSKAAQYAHLQKGGTFLKTAQFGDEEDRILLRADRTPVYLVADLVYHREKFLRGFDRIVDVIGADHAGHAPKIRAAMRALGYSGEKLDFLLVQMVRLVRDGQELRFSKRTGQIILLSEFLEEIGVDVARFVFLMRSANTQFDFDLDLLRSQSSDNPIFNVQYGHARMATLLKRAAEAGKEFVGLPGLKNECLARLTLKEELEMLKKAGELPDLVLGAAEALEPHRIIYYCQELVGDFHSYFTRYKATEKIISDDFELTQGRLAMVAALKQVIKNALGLLGISAPDHMKAPEENEKD